jgi:hypothetical protein
MYEWSLGENVCCYLAHDCKVVSIDEDLNQTREKISQLTSVVGFNMVDLNDVMDFLMYNKEELFTDDLIALEKESMEEAG